MNGLKQGVIDAFSLLDRITDNEIIFAIINFFSYILGYTIVIALVVGIIGVIVMIIYMLCISLVDLKREI